MRRSHTRAVGRRPRRRRSRTRTSRPSSSGPAAGEPARERVALGGLDQLLERGRRRAPPASRSSAGLAPSTVPSGASSAASIAGSPRCSPRSARGSWRRRSARARRRPRASASLAYASAPVRSARSAEPPNAWPPTSTNGAGSRPRSAAQTSRHLPAPARAARPTARRASRPARPRARRGPAPGVSWPRNATCQPSASRKSATIRPPTACSSSLTHATTRGPARTRRGPVGQRSGQPRHRGLGGGGREVLLRDADLGVRPPAPDLVERRLQHVEVDPAHGHAGGDRLVEHRARAVRGRRPSSALEVAVAYLLGRSAERAVLGRRPASAANSTHDPRGQTH